MTESFTTRLAQYQDFFSPGFLGWLDDNPGIYRLFEETALRMVLAGRDRFSARSIVHMMRDDSPLAEVGSGFKINNNHSPDMGRVFVIRFPAYADRLEFRRHDREAFLAAVVGVHRNPPAQSSLF